jgi:Na+-driven multidrug efflux pump
MRRSIRGVTRRKQANSANNLATGAIRSQSLRRQRSHRAKTAVTAGLVSSLAFALVVEFGAVLVLVDGDH